MSFQNRYFLMRHGQSQANVADIIISRPETGVSEYGLTPLGREQARRSAESSDLDSTTVIVASDFLRTRETAETVREVLSASGVTLEPGLRERNFAELEGRQGELYKEVWELDSVDPHNTLHGAESPFALAQRVELVLKKLEASYRNQTVLLVSHGDTLRFLQLAAMGRQLTEHLDIKLFEPAEIRALENLPAPKC